MSQRVVVTGIGLLSPIGKTVDGFWAALSRKAEPPGEVTLFDAAPFAHKRAYQVPEFSLHDYVKEISMHRMERFSKLVLAAGSLAIQDAGLVIDAGNADRIGSIVTTVYGPVNVTVKYLKDLVQAGPAQVSPIYFQQTVMNVASGQLSIQYRLKGVSSTLVGSSSVAYAYELIREGRADVVLAIGVEELCEQVFHAYSENGFLSVDGLELGEGCGVLVLESLEHARRREARQYGELVDYLTLADARMNRHVTILEEGPDSALYRGMAAWLEGGALQPQDVGLVSRLANGAPVVEEAEGAALAALYGADVPTVAVKAHLGETLGASEVFSMAAALLALERGAVPDPEAPGGTRPLTGRYALCNSTFVGGSVNAWLLRRAG